MCYVLRPPNVKRWIEKGAGMKRTAGRLFSERPVLGWVLGWVADKSRYMIQLTSMMRVR